MLHRRAAYGRLSCFRAEAGATIGRGAAVVQLGKWKFTGYFAWLTWLFVHLLFLVQFQNRLMVLMQWAWNYFTWDRSARLITGPPDAEERRGASS